MTICEIADHLKTGDEYLIITHTRPDGDTIGSAAALTALLRGMGKTAYMLKNRELTERYAGLVDGLTAPESFQPRQYIAVDTASEGLFPLGFDTPENGIDICIDHHPSNTCYAKNTYVDSSAGACGEIIFELYEHFGAELTKTAAEQLYTAIATDTGCFAYGNTSPRTLFAASKLVAAGIDNGDINKRLFRTKTSRRIKLEGLLYNGMEFFDGGSIVFMPVTLEMISICQADENDMDDIAAIPGTVEGAVAAATLKERTDGTVKVSVRTQSGLDAGAICAVFDGGGHAAAAGCVIAGTIDDAKKALLDVIRQEMQK